MYKNVSFDDRYNIQKSPEERGRKQKGEIQRSVQTSGTSASEQPLLLTPLKHQRSTSLRVLLKDPVARIDLLRGNVVAQGILSLRHG